MCVSGGGGVSGVCVSGGCVLVGGGGGCVGGGVSGGWSWSV